MAETARERMIREAAEAKAAADAARAATIAEVRAKSDAQKAQSAADKQAAIDAHNAALADHNK